ncbi:MAG: chemotaxis protein CheW [Planctomycetes bacterium]|nr:chemotaxis protein CheW [Planctomycetota bacterium]
MFLRAGSLLCAIPTIHVSETMRPLEIEPVSGMPEFVLGLAVIRGAAVPVVSLELMLRGAKTETVSRFVTIRVQDRIVALAVTEVIGVSDLENIDLHELPPLVKHANGQIVEAIGALDEQLLLILKTARILPDEAWKNLQNRGE